MNKAFVVAKWEFVEKVKSKAFIISLILMPVIILTFGILPTFLATREEERTIDVGIVDDTGNLFSIIERRVTDRYKLDDGRPAYVVRNFSGSGQEARDRALQSLQAESIEGFFAIPTSVTDSGRIEYRARNVGNFRIQERFSRTVEEILTERRLDAAGLDPELFRKMSMDVNVRAIKVSDSGSESETGFLETFFSSYIVLMMLMFLIMTSGQLLIRSVVEEKQNRVIEVLLSSCTSQELMTGKILGLSGLGFVQMAVWLIGILAVMLRTGQISLEPDMLLFSFLYFALGYLLYSGIFVAAGSPVTTEQEAQQITTYVSLTLVFPIVLAVPVMQNPDSTMIQILSFIPLLTPAFMVLRMSVEMPAGWEIAGTLLLLAASAVGMMWVAGKVFRIAILVYGKRPTIRQLIGWVTGA